MPAKYTWMALPTCLSPSHKHAYVNITSYSWYLIIVVISIQGIWTASDQLVSNRKHEVILRCYVDSSKNAELKIEWFRNSKKLSSLQNIKFQKNRLIIHDPGTNENGLYRCIISNSAGQARSEKKKGFVLKWFGSADDTSTSPNCIPRMKKNQDLSTSSHDVFLCRGKRGGGGGVLHKDNNIFMTENAEISHETTDKKVVNEGDTTELLCQHYIPHQIRRATFFELRWRKDAKIFRQLKLGQGALTTTEPNMEAMMLDEGRVMLNRWNGSLIFQTTFASDAGQYFCEIQIETSPPVISDGVVLQIIDQLKFMPQPTSKNLELGSVGKVHCKVQGTPIPSVKWVRDMNTDDAFHITVDDINGTLIFKNVTAKHRGNYTCIARNSQGQINATVSINVVVAPKFSLVPRGPIETVEMSTVALHCQALGNPNPTIQWDKDLKYLRENNTDRNRFKFFENGTLEIREVNLKDGGRYGCTIGNIAGLKREQVRFIVKSNDGFVSEESPNHFLITRGVLITISVAFSYIILIVGLIIWCRLRSQIRKSRLNASIKDNVESGEEGKAAENEPCMPGGSKSYKEKSSRKNNPNHSKNEAQKSDETISSANSKGSGKSHALDQLFLPRCGITELIQIGRGGFGDVFVGKIKTSFIKVTSEKAINTEKHSPLNVAFNPSFEKRSSKTSMNDIEEITEEMESPSDDVQGQPNTSDGYKLVLVKALNKIKDENTCQEFKRQIEMFRGITHKDVVRVFGVCREKYPHYLVLEYSDWGDLKQFLLATAGKVNPLVPIDNAGSPPPLKSGQILAVAYQIARGMDAIYRARFIHKDLATRNCIISSDFIVKVSYPALSKDKYSREYFKHRNILLPIRWLAPECIQEDEYTTKSDIFSFGVVVWELFNQATKIPFEELTNEEVVERSCAGKLSRNCARNTPTYLYNILMSCWSVNPNERPSFSELCTAFSKAMQNVDK